MKLLERVYTFQRSQINMIAIFTIEHRYWQDGDHGFHQECRQQMAVGLYLVET